MAAIQSPLCSSSSFASVKKLKAAHQAPKLPSGNLYFPSKIMPDDLNQGRGFPGLISNSRFLMDLKPDIQSKTRSEAAVANPEALKELYAILEIVSDRAEMHKNIGIQRDNWNRLLLNSVNGMTVTAATMAGLAVIGGAGAPTLALKFSSSLLYLAVSGILLGMNKIQPSQLAEEQRNAHRLFRQLHEEIKTTIVLGNLTSIDVKLAMEKVLALDKAYPLPLLGAMLDKFPQVVQPAVWWPNMASHQEKAGAEDGKNGWNETLEQELRGVLAVLKRKDEAEYMRLSKVALKINKFLAVTGPLLTGMAAVGSFLVGTPLCSSWAGFLGVTFGAMATVVNTLQHGGQVGMVFEMYRGSAGFFKLMEETIESNLKEREVEKRENGESLEVKVALQLGRSLSDLKELAASSSSSPEVEQSKEEFASKLF